MTREEAIVDIRDNIKPVVGGKSLDMAIEALDQEPCEDAINRGDMEECKELMTDINGDTVYAVKMSHIRQLPSVKPQEPKTIQEIQAESEKYEKAFEDGYEQGYAQARFDYEQEPCEDAISRQAVLDCLTATGLKKYDFILNARDKIKNLPPVKPQEPFNIDTYCKEHFVVMVDKDVWEKAEKALKEEHTYGYWRQVGRDIYECTVCSQNVMTGDICAYKHCHGCGAKMIEPQESEG